MPYYDLNNENEEITLEKLLENYRFIEYITTKNYRENPSAELLKDRRGYRKSIKMLKRVLKKKIEKDNGKTEADKT